MSDKKIKQNLQRILSEAFHLSLEKVEMGKTTDLIVHCGDNENEYLYFEVKSTNKDNRKNKNCYFGATSLNQLIEAEKHPNHFYYIIVSSSKDGDSYTIVKPEVLLSYMTGCYISVDFNIPERILKQYSVDEDLFKDGCVKLQNRQNLVDMEYNQKPKVDKIKEVKDLVKKNLKNSVKRGKTNF